jgi:pimeloyl-ACP methyl ester carboxylesterase
MNNKKSVLAVALAIVIGVAVFFGFRQAPMQYRTDHGLCRVTPQAVCDRAAWSVESRKTAESAAVAGDDIHLGFIEFDDQGQLWDRGRADEVLGAVRALAAQRPVSIVVFAHGWNHNASVDDSNVLSFRQMLRDLFDAEARFAQLANRSQDRAIVGIYLGWRGKSATGPFQYPTFWARKTTAQRVGNDGAFEILYRLSAIRNGGVQPARNRLVMVGHSFGGALMFTATAHALTGSLEDMSIGRGKRFADLVVIINPAIEAQRFESLFRRSRELEPSLRGQMPLMVVITSAGDLATKVAFPLGRWFATLFNSYRPAQAPTGSSGLMLDEAAADRTAVGHYAPYLTHVLAPCVAESAMAALQSCSPQTTPVASTHDFNDPQYLQAVRSTATAWKKDREAANWHIQFPTAVLLHAAGPVNGPVMNVITHQSLILGHNGIWGSPVMLFVRDLIAVDHLVDRSVEPTAAAEPTAAVSSQPH